MNDKKHVAIILFDGVNALDVAGPAEAFSTARGASGEPAYWIETWGLDRLDCMSESRLKLTADKLLQDPQTCDMLIIPGGKGARSENVIAPLSAWLKQYEQRCNQIVTICTGAYPLAKSGLADGRKMTTHWAYGSDLQSRCPSITVETDNLFVRDGKFYSSGGVAAGIDLALEMITEDLGQAAAMDVAKQMVVFLRRSGGQSQFSSLLRLQSGTTKPIDEVCHWAAANLDADLGNEVLAEKAGLSVRQFTRRFVEAIGEPPAAHINRLRIEAAKTALSQGSNIALTANAVGFASTDGFRKSFEKIVGISPGEYHKRFSQKQEAL